MWTRSPSSRSPRPRATTAGRMSRLARRSTSSTRACRRSARTSKTSTNACRILRTRPSSNSPDARRRPRRRRAEQPPGGSPRWRPTGVRDLTPSRRRPHVVRGRVGHQREGHADGGSRAAGGNGLRGNGSGGRGRARATGRGTRAPRARTSRASPAQSTLSRVILRPARCTKCESIGRGVVTPGRLERVELRPRGACPRRSVCWCRSALWPCPHRPHTPPPPCVTSPTVSCRSASLRVPMAARGSLPPTGACTPTSARPRVRAHTPSAVSSGAWARRGHAHRCRCARHGADPSFPVLPSNVIFGRDGNLYGAGSSTGAVFRVTPAGVVTKIETTARSVGTVALGPDRRVWFGSASEAALSAASARPAQRRRSTRVSRAAS